MNDSKSGKTGLEFHSEVEQFCVNKFGIRSAESIIAHIDFWMPTTEYQKQVYLLLKKHNSDQLRQLESALSAIVPVVNQEIDY